MTCLKDAWHLEDNFTLVKSSDNTNRSAYYNKRLFFVLLYVSPGLHKTDIITRMMPVSVITIGGGVLCG